MNSLKDQNTKYIIFFVTWCTLLFIVCFGTPLDLWTVLNEVFFKLNAKNSIFIILCPLIAVLVPEFFTPNFKAILVFWRIKNALPGHRAFSEYAKNDPRIDINNLKSKIGSLPTDPNDQNKIWYGIYKNYKDEPSVVNAHRLYLLTRDLLSINIIFLIYGTFIIYIFKNSLKWTMIYFIITGIQFIFLTQVGRNSGIRLVKNVLAEASINNNSIMN